MMRYTPMRTGGFGALGMGKWTDFTWTGATGNGRGVGVDNRSPTSFAWLALDGSNGLGKLRSTPTSSSPTARSRCRTSRCPRRRCTRPTAATRRSAPVSPPTSTSGASASATTVSPSGNATHFHVDTNGVVTARPRRSGEARRQRLDAGRRLDAPAPYPYTYSDFTGFGLRNFTNPHGSTRTSGPAAASPRPSGSPSSGTRPRRREPRSA